MPEMSEWVLVPREPTEEMWSGLARDLVFWQRQHPHTGKTLYEGLRMVGRAIPDWLLKEISDTDSVPSKGTVAACIYKAQLAAAPAPPAQGEVNPADFMPKHEHDAFVDVCFTAMRTAPEFRPARIRLSFDDLRTMSKALANLMLRWQAEREPRKENAALIVLRAQADALAEALEKIAAFDDVGASERLARTGSYALFDEPGAVETARAALAAYRNPQNPQKSPQ